MGNMEPLGGVPCKTCGAAVTWCEPAPVQRKVKGKWVAVKQTGWDRDVGDPDPYGRHHCARLPRPFEDYLPVTPPPPLTPTPPVHSARTPPPARIVNAPPELGIPLSEAMRGSARGREARRTVEDAVDERVRDRD